MFEPISAGARTAGRDDGLPPPSMLVKAQRILDVFDGEADRLSLTELCRRSGVAKATVHRICQELTAWGALERVGTDYRLGLRIFALGQLVPRRRVLADVARPVMEDLLVATGEAVHLAVPDGLRVLYLDKLGSRSVARPSRVGGHLPMHCTSTGKVILAFSPRALVDQVLRAGLSPVTRHTVTTPGRLLGQLHRARSAGCFTEVEETRLGYSSTAAPLFGTGGVVVGALSVTSSSYRPRPERVLTAVRGAAAEISRSLRALG